MTSEPHADETIDVSTEGLAADSAYMAELDGEIEETVPRSRDLVQTGALPAEVPGTQTRSLRMGRYVRWTAVRELQQSKDG